jgi:hypothetical protein
MSTSFKIHGKAVLEDPPVWRQLVRGAVIFFVRGGCHKPNPRQQQTTCPPELYRAIDAAIAGFGVGGLIFLAIVAGLCR